MKKLIFTLFALMISVSTFAQFERDTYYINTSFSKVGMSFSGQSKFSLAGSATAGLFIEDNWAAVAEAGIDYGNKHLQEFSAGGGLRYYIQQNGIYLGLSGKYLHSNYRNVDGGNYNDVQIKAEVGYAYFLSRTVTIEPAVFYSQSFKDQDYSQVGFKLGFGFYF